jgi:hypothetical protein
VPVDLHERSCIGVQILEQGDKVIAEAIAAEYRERVFMSDAVKCMLKIKSEDTQREMHIFCVGGYAPHYGYGVKNRIASHPTVLRGVEKQINERAKPLSKDARRKPIVGVQGCYRTTVGGRKHRTLLW